MSDDPIIWTLQILGGFVAAVAVLWIGSEIWQQLMQDSLAGVGW